jgi:arginine repressor
MKIEDFKKKKKPKNKSKLFDFKNEILQLIKDEYSQESICEFLKENGVQTKQSNISQFVKKLKKTQEPKKEIPKIEEKKASISTNEIKQESTPNTGIQFPKLQRIGKDTDIKDAPDWAK